MSLYSDAVQSFLQSNLIVGADVLTYKTARIAVRNRRIVKICMDYSPNMSFVLYSLLIIGVPVSAIFTAFTSL